MSLQRPSVESASTLGLILPPSSITAEKVCICRQSLVLPEYVVRELKACLSPDEVARADRFHFKKDSDRFIITRSALRYTLARELKILPREIEFQYGDHGKPSLANSMQSDIEFNVTHSGGFALLAYVTGADIGVDIEEIRPMKDITNIARRYFSPFEMERLRSLPEAQQELAFFSIWSRKEAIVKAIGSGLSLPLSSFDVAVEGADADSRSGPIDGNYPQSLLVAMRSTEVASAIHAAEWQLYDLPAPPGYKAAIAIRSQAPRDIETVL